METLNYDNLFAGDYPVVTDIVTVKQGQVLSRGACLGEITAESKHVIVDSAADPADGSETPVSILAEDVDATDGDVQATVYLSGAFNEAKVSFGGDDTADDHRAALRARNIYLKKAVAA